MSLWGNWDGIFSQFCDTAHKETNRLSEIIIQINQA